MLLAFIVLLSALFLLLTLGQILTVNISIKDEVSISCDFLFLKLYLFPFRKTASLFQKNKEKRDKKESFSKKFNKGKVRFILLQEILKRSEIDIVDIGFQLPYTEQSDYLLKRERYSSLISAVLAALKSSSRSFVCRDFDFFKDYGDGIFLNVFLKMSVFDIIASLLYCNFKQRKILSIGR